MLENAITKIPKKYSMTIGSKAWREGILDKLQRLILNLERQVCDLCLFLTCSDS